MRILCIVPVLFSRGGAGVHERKIVEHLSKTDYLCVLTSIRIGQFKRGTEIAGDSKHFRFLYIPKLKPEFLFNLFYGLLVGLVLSTLNFIRRKSFYDVIYVRDVSFLLGLAFTRALHRTPLSLKLCGFSDEYQFLFPSYIYKVLSPVLKIFEKNAIQFSDLVIVQSTLFREELISRFGMAQASKTIAISAGVDPSEFHIEGSMREREEKSRFVLGYIGNLLPWQGLDILIKSVDILKNRIPNLNVLIITKDNTTPLNSLINESGHFPFFRVVRNVPQNKMLGLLKEIDLMIIPRYRISTTELTLPIKLLESFAVGKPVVVSETKIIETAFEDGKDILTFEPGNPQDLAEKVYMLYSNPSLRATLSSSSYTFARKYDWSVVIPILRESLKRISKLRSGHFHN